MDQRKPLSYESLKTVIQYMDSNFRLVRLRQISSLRNIQKVVPLRLGVLELNDSTFTFDNIEYTYKHCREFIKNDGDPVTLLYSECDFNNNGEKEIFHDLMPGEIVIKERDWRDFPNRDIHFINDSYVLCRVRTGLNNPYRTRQSHRGIKLRDTIRKKLHEVLGGKRIHQVEHLKIRIYHGVLRLPEGLKLKIRELSIEDNSMAVIDAILPILDVSSFPLKSLSIKLENPQDPIVQSEILRTSELLNIENRVCFGNSLPNLLINLPNMKIHLKNQILLDEIIPLVRNWMEHPRVIGRKFSMQSVSAKEYLDGIKKEFKAVVRVLSERKCTMISSCFTLPLTSTSELNFYGVQSSNYEEELKKGMAQHYMIVMEVIPIGTDKHLKDQDVRK